MRLKWIYVLMSASLLQTVTINSVLAETKIKYGEWELNVSIEGLPIAVPMQTQHICLDKDHLVPNQSETQGCKISWQIKNNTVNWSVICSNGGNGKGRVVYNWDTLQGTSEMNMPSAKMSLHATQTGKWLAATCSEESRRMPQSSQLR